MPDFKIEICIDIKKIYFNCPKINCRNEVFLNVELFNKIIKSKLLPARFPICVNEVFKFHKFFFDCRSYFQIIDRLNDIPFTMEMLEYDYRNCKEKRVAYFDSNASDIARLFDLKPVEMNNRSICMVNRQLLNDFDPPMITFSSYACICNFPSSQMDMCSSPPPCRSKMKESLCCNEIPKVCRSSSLSPPCSTSRRPTFGCRSPPLSPLSSSFRRPISACRSPSLPPLCSSYRRPSPCRSPLPPLCSRSRRPSSGYRSSPLSSPCSSFKRPYRCRSSSPPLCSSSRRMRSISPLMCSSRMSPNLCTVSSELNKSYDDCWNLELSRLTKNLKEVSAQIRDLTVSQRCRTGTTRQTLRCLKPVRCRPSRSVPCCRPIC